MERKPDNLVDPLEGDHIKWEIRGQSGGRPVGETVRRQDRDDREPAGDQPHDQFLALDDELVELARPVRRLERAKDGDPGVVQVLDRHDGHCVDLVCLVAPSYRERSSHSLSLRPLRSGGQRARLPIISLIPRMDRGMMGSPGPEEPWRQRNHPSHTPHAERRIGPMSRIPLPHSLVSPLVLIAGLWSGTTSAAEGRFRASPCPRAGRRTGSLCSRSPQCHHGRGGGQGRSHDPGRGGEREDGGHGGLASRGQPVPGQGGRGRVRRQRVRQARRLDPGGGAGDDRNPDRPDQHALRRHGRRGGRRSHPQATGKRAGPLGQRPRGRDERRGPERHPRSACQAGARRRGHFHSEWRAGGRGLGRGGDGDLVLRLEGRDRHVLPRPPGSVRRLLPRRARADELRRGAHDRRRPGREGARPL